MIRNDVCTVNLGQCKHPDLKCRDCDDFKNEQITCPFCKMDKGSIVAGVGTCYAIFDKYPVNKGHMLIIPFRHRATFFDLTDQELEHTLILLDGCKKILDEKYAPDGYNVGFNVGEAAGQTVMHCHCHLIPRYKGDVPEPRGGIRGVIPSKRDY